MDDDEILCPLCCEEMDVSDRQFYPCKCGYQVCMWCWHRIKEQETGLCPACRTPYGDNPHQFSAVDVEEVLKANKEKEEAAKRERQRRSQSALGTGTGDGPEGSGGGVGSSQGGVGENAEAVLTRLSNNRSTGRMDLPHDRQQLLGMRVIRRNLVYAVGLPPSIANEDLLRRPEYFGQYGKISKIVLNRGTPAQGRPATASAYVTFVHKEDTLACILALDGFFVEGRNIRASYGTSKYCSAFMRSMKCTNPECTYLHEMGDIEDTFTKAEIQAGYVTSGRDVLARQQQIVQQALSAASGAAGTAPRKRVGGGGPSGTGKAATNPVFPAPTYDEPARTSTAHLVPPTPISAQKRALTTSTAIPIQQPVAAVAQHGRSSSIGASAPAQASASRKGNIVNAVVGGATAASVVAGVRPTPAQPESSVSHSTLTALTPLKRANAAASKLASKTSYAQGTANQEITKLPNMRTGPKKSNGVKMSSATSMSTSPSNSEAGSASSNRNTSASAPPYSIATDVVSSIGGDVIAAPLPVSSHVPLGEPIGLSSIGAGLPARAVVGANYALSGGGGPSLLSELVGPSGGDGLGGLGGEVFDGPLQSTSATKSAIGASKDKWNSGDSIASSNNGDFFGGSGSGAIGGSTLPGLSDAIGGGIIGGGGPFGGHASGSSALASMLGIDLPTGSGSLRESSSLWSSMSPAPPMQQAPISALNGSSVPLQGVIGGGAALAQPAANHTGLIGGLPIGGGGICQHAPNGGIMGGTSIGGGSGGGRGGTSSDIALLQSLLPGVHITSGGSYQNNSFGTIGSNNSGVGNPTSNWNTGPGAGTLLSHGQTHQQNSFDLQSSLSGQPQPIGTIGQGKQRHAPGNIW